MCSRLFYVRPCVTQNRNVENICNGGVAQRQSLRAMRAPYLLCSVSAASLVELEDKQPVQQCMMIGTSTCHDKVRTKLLLHWQFAQSDPISDSQWHICIRVNQ